MTDAQIGEVRGQARGALEIHALAELQTVDAGGQDHRAPPVGSIAR